ncbi:MAG: hypothetical protein Q9163_001426 [Psora crenata]
MALPRSNPLGFDASTPSGSLSPTTALPPRSRSIQFSTAGEDRSSPAPMPHNGEDNSASHATESSADEITPIMSHERGGNGKKSRNYDTAAPSRSEDDGFHGQSGSMGRSVSNARRRKKGRDSLSAGRGGAEENDGEECGGGAVGKQGIGSWLKDMLDKYGSVELDNKGSVARDHLALERTFLAWLRTSLAFASIGIAVTQLFRLNTTIEERDGYIPQNPPGTYHLRQVGKPLGATFLGISILVLLLGGRRYFESQYWIIRGKFPASRGSIFLIMFVAAALIVTSLIVACVVDPSVFEKK